MSRVSIRPSGSYTPSGGRTPRSPSENMVTADERVAGARMAGALNERVATEVESMTCDARRGGRWGTMPS